MQIKKNELAQFDGNATILDFAVILSHNHVAINISLHPIIWWEIFFLVRITIMKLILFNVNNFLRFYS